MIQGRRNLQDPWHRDWGFHPEPTRYIFGRWSRHPEQCTDRGIFHVQPSLWKYSPSSVLSQVSLLSSSTGRRQILWEEYVPDFFAIPAFDTLIDPVAWNEWKPAFFWHGRPLSRSGMVLSSLPIVSSNGISDPISFFCYPGHSYHSQTPGDSSPAGLSNITGSAITNAFYPKHFFSEWSASSVCYWGYADSKFDLEFSWLAIHWVPYLSQRGILSPQSNSNWIPWTGSDSRDSDDRSSLETGQGQSTSFRPVVPGSDTNFNLKISLKPQCREKFVGGKDQNHVDWRWLIELVTDEKFYRCMNDLLRPPTHPRIDAKKIVSESILSINSISPKEKIVFLCIKFCKHYLLILFLLKSSQ